jgi:hypothetical protein
VKHVIEKNRLNIFGQQQFLGVAAGVRATTQPMSVRAAKGRLFPDRSIKLAQFEEADSFRPLKQIDAGVVNVGYIEAGPAAGLAVILLPGWPVAATTKASTVLMSSPPVGFDERPTSKAG